MTELPGDTRGPEHGEVAYYYPAPFWQMGEGDWIKTLLLFFDQVAILLPKYMRGREIASDPVLAGPLSDLGLLLVLEPETFVDQTMAESLSTVLAELLVSGAFDDLDRGAYYQALSHSRLGRDADVDLAGMILGELRKRNLAHESEDGVSVPLHPVVRSTVLVLLSQLARPRGVGLGLDLSPTTNDAQAIRTLLSTLALPEMPSAGHVVALDLEVVTLNLEAVPLDEVLDFRAQHRSDHRSYLTQVRRTLAELGAVDSNDREQLLLDRRDELADQADALRRLSRRSWRRPLASFSLGAAGAAWAGGQSDAITAALSFAGGLLGMATTGANAGAYSYLFEAQRSLDR